MQKFFKPSNFTLLASISDFRLLLGKLWCSIVGFLSFETSIFQIPTSNFNIQS